jgi:hypothetical protein
MSQQISSHDLAGLLDLWKHLDSRIFSKLDTAKVRCVFRIYSKLLIECTSEHGACLIIVFTYIVFIVSVRKARYIVFFVFFKLDFLKDCSNCTGKQ